MGRPRPHAMWVTWEWHRRSAELCSYLGIDLTVLEVGLPRLLRHPVMAVRTVWHLVRSRPRTLVVQNPSMFLGLLAVLLKPLLGYELLVDAHNAAIDPENPVLQRLHGIQRFIQKHADVTIVTNEALAEVVRENGGHALVLPDRLPTPPDSMRSDLETDRERSILLICTFGSDEPYEAFLSAAARLPSDIRVYVTGSERRIPTRYLESPPANVTFTGFVPEERYWSLLASVDLVVDLTTRENCLVCGGYEAVAVGAPLLLSDTRALRDYFRKGVRFTGNDEDAVLRSVLDALEDTAEIRQGVQELRDLLEEEWAASGERFRAQLGTGPGVDQALHEEGGPREDSRETTTSKSESTRPTK